MTTVVATEKKAKNTYKKTKNNVLKQQKTQHKKAFF